MDPDRFSHPHARVELSPEGVATVRIVDAGSLNILGSAVIAGLTQAFNDLAGRAAVRVVILRGDGERAFVAGADISEMATLDNTRAQRFIAGLCELCDTVRFFPVPVIARIPGHCLGAGLELAAACDLRLAGDAARFGMPEVEVGIPSVIHAALLPALIGAARAQWLLLTGESVDAATAQDWGLVHRVLPDSELDGAVAALAARLAGFGPQALRQQKRLLRRWEKISVDEAIADSVAEFGAAFDTGEPQTHMQAFLARKAAR
ncbi:enoyl-CoA hydratase [Bordetella genomosp. 1]|uniref:Enoyl-CoA hydratase n=1 Tax=Bordetella genomosp. 1 TaxID=1395607 RepID=A0A261ST61_9BORD|nr:enoyl-CoA hydratase [Bordetella genomosp. 1]MDQ8033725.1 enoyl-CoA hydratase [Bordetella sp.]OZI40574.1 enoyl-CoA hydratase [Bordetella genomosp. 1]OZI68766.1 enoyl-CoA hydratase [Bordetella genomosp. 1]